MSNNSKIIVILLILIRSAIAQSGFNNYYLSGYLSTGNKIIEIDPGKFMVTSYYKDSATQQQGLDLKHIDMQGNVLLRKRYLFQNMDFLSFNYSHFQEDLSQKTAILTGGTYSGSISTQIFLSVNKNSLDTNWVKYYSDGLNNYLNTVFKTKPNEIWLFGDRGNSSGSRPATIKIDSMGNILSVKHFTVLEKYSVRASTYDPIQNLIYFTGNNYNNSSAHKTYIACMDTTGFVVWKTEFPNSQYNPYYSKIERKDNYLVLCGSQGEFTYGGFSQDRLLITKVNSSNGAISWSKKYFTTFYTNYLSSLIINPDESIVTTGSGGFFSQVVDYNNDGIILKVNSVGDSLWMQSFGNYGQGTMEIFYDLIRTSDGGYLLSGLSNNTLTLHTWIVKTDSLGIGPGRTTGLTNKIVNYPNLKIYPQPANDELYISFAGDENTVYSIKVFNAIGQMVKEKEIFITQNYIKLHTTELPSGIYTLRISGESNFLLNNRFIITR